MKTILVTGSSGFIGKHVVQALGRRKDVQLRGFDKRDERNGLERHLASIDLVIHLAGVNRPKQDEEFSITNADLTRRICRELAKSGRKALIVLASSVQAALDNPYGKSKKEAEDTVEAYARGHNARAVIFRLKNVFGKWCRPNYNSVTATFCHNIAHDLPITISDSRRSIELFYIDDVVEALAETLDNPPAAGQCERREVSTSYTVTLGRLAELIRSFRESRSTLTLPSFADRFIRVLYATYLSYVEGPDFRYELKSKTDNRGDLAEVMKSDYFGQIFVSRTRPGITRGDHFHHTKTEKFMVLEGEALIRFRHILGTEVVEHRVSGREFTVVDIPPGYTHNITNLGQGDLVTLFWASEVFDPARPDTYMMPVSSAPNNWRPNTP